MEYPNGHLEGGARGDLRFPSFSYPEAEILDSESQTKIATPREARLAMTTFYIFTSSTSFTSALTHFFHFLRGSARNDSLRFAAVATSRKHTVYSFQPAAGIFWLSAVDCRLFFPTLATSH